MHGLQGAKRVRAPRVATYVVFLESRAVCGPLTIDCLVGDDLEKFKTLIYDAFKRFGVDEEDYMLDLRDDEGYIVIREDSVELFVEEVGKSALLEKERRRKPTKKE